MTRGAHRTDGRRLEAGEEPHEVARLDVRHPDGHHARRVLRPPTDRGRRVHGDPAPAHVSGPLERYCCRTAKAWHSEDECDRDH